MKTYYFNSWSHNREQSIHRRKFCILLSNHRRKLPINLCLKFWDCQNQINFNKQIRTDACFFSNWCESWKATLMSNLMSETQWILLELKFAQIRIFFSASIAQNRQGSWYRIDVTSMNWSWIDHRSQTGRRFIFSIIRLIHSFLENRLKSINFVDRFVENIFQNSPGVIKVGSHKDRFHAIGQLLVVADQFPIQQRKMSFQIPDLSSPSDTNEAHVEEIESDHSG